MDQKWSLFRRFGKSLIFEQIPQTIDSGKKLPDGTFHHVQHTWIRNDIDEYLIFRRATEKRYSLYWESIEGSVLAGETSKQAAIRKVKEELGLDLQSGFGKFVCRGVRHFDSCDDFVDVWLFDVDSKTADRKLTLHTEEVDVAVWVPSAAIRLLQEQGFWIPWKQFDYLDQILEEEPWIDQMTRENSHILMRDLNHAAMAFCADKLYDLALVCGRKAFDTEMEALEKWPVENQDEYDWKIGSAKSRLVVYLISAGQYEEAEKQINEALFYFDAIQRRGERPSVIWQLHHAHFLKRRIMIRTGRKKEVLVERGILNRIKNGEYGEERP